MGKFAKLQSLDEVKKSKKMRFRLSQPEDGKKRDKHWRSISSGQSGSLAILNVVDPKLIKYDSQFITAGARLISQTIDLWRRLIFSFILLTNGYIYHDSNSSCGNLGINKHFSEIMFQHCHELSFQSIKSFQKNSLKLQKILI